VMYSLDSMIPRPSMTCNFSDIATLLVHGAYPRHVPTLKQICTYSFFLPHSLTRAKLVPLDSTPIATHAAIL
jgi:hypothetical protein